MCWRPAAGHARTSGLCRAFAGQQCQGRRGDGERLLDARDCANGRQGLTLPRRRMDQRARSHRAALQSPPQNLTPGYVRARLPSMSDRDELDAPPTEPAAGHCFATSWRPEPLKQNANLSKLLVFLAIPAGFEPATPRLGIWCSIQLSYGTVVVFGARRLDQRNTEVPARPPRVKSEASRNAPLRRLRRGG